MALVISELTQSCVLIGVRWHSSPNHICLPPVSGTTICTPPSHVRTFSGREDVLAGPLKFKGLLHSYHLALELGFNLGLGWVNVRLGICSSCDARARSYGIDDVFECPHKDRSTRMCVCFHDCTYWHLTAVLFMMGVWLISMSLVFAGPQNFILSSFTAIILSNLTWLLFETVPEFSVSF